MLIFSDKCFRRARIIPLAFATGIFLREIKELDFLLENFRRDWKVSKQSGKFLDNR